MRVAWFGIAVVGLVGGAAIAACAKGDASDVDNGASSSGGSSSTLGDGAPGNDARDGASPANKDGSTSNTDANAPKDAAVGQDASGLDPDLGLPAAGGNACSPPGSSCPGIKVCRISSPTGGTCEGCGPCGNLNAPCTTSAQCDILFQCYKGKCTNICPLGTTYCGAPADCINVGHATHGVCKPF